MAINKIKGTKGRFGIVGKYIEGKYLLGMNTLKAQTQLAKVSFWLASWALNFNSNHLRYLLGISYILKILSINGPATHEVNHTSFFLVIIMWFHFLCTKDKLY